MTPDQSLASVKNKKLCTKQFYNYEIQSIQRGLAINGRDVPEVFNRLLQILY